VTPTYILIGAGGTGSLLMDPMLRMLRTFHGTDDFVVAIIDGDNVEPKNLARQQFAGKHVGLNKAAALADFVYSGDTASIHAVPEFLSDENIGDRIQDGDVVIIAADNYNVRARIEQRALELDNIVVINGGNESFDGSCQIFVRKDGKNLTPPLSWMHDEIYTPSEHDPSKLDCIARANIKGGEQTIIANLMSAAWTLNMLYRYLVSDKDPIVWHETFFDMKTGNAKAYDWRDEEGGWLTHHPTPTGAVALKA
jgi:molybdopterin/thiamine biosynthesis adenylyltransferase